nr:helix-turn-helix transcriptional regulator [Pseudomonas aeruginosa]
MPALRTAIPVLNLRPLSPEEFRAELAARGWDAKTLALYWEMTPRRGRQISADANRPRYYDDALRGLPAFSAAIYEKIRQKGPQPIPAKTPKKSPAIS